MRTLSLFTLLCNTNNVDYLNIPQLFKTHYNHTVAGVKGSRHALFSDGIP